MTTLDELDDLWPPPDPAVLEREPRKCGRHRWNPEVIVDGEFVRACERCGRPFDATRARRGKTSRNRGNAFEREVAAKLGGVRKGQFGDKVDVEVPGWLRVQCKNGTAYPERMDGWLRAIPFQADLLRAVVLGDAPGSAGKRRSLIVLDLDEFASWYGKR